MRMRHIVIASLPDSTIFFPHYLINRTFFEKKNYWTWNACFDFLYNFCPKHFSFYEEVSEIWSKIYIGRHVKHSFLDRISKNSLISNFMKIRPVGAELFHADRRTDRDMTKLIPIFRNFPNAPKSWSSINCGHNRYTADSSVTDIFGSTLRHVRLCLFPCLNLRVLQSVTKIGGRGLVTLRASFDLSMVANNTWGFLEHGSVSNWHFVRTRLQIYDRMDYEALD